MKRLFLILFMLVIVFSLSACADTTVKGSVVCESADGNAELDIMPQKMLEIANVGETVIVTIGDFSGEMLFVDELIEEDGKLQLFLDEEDWNISVCSYNQRFCDLYAVGDGEKVEIKK